MDGGIMSTVKSKKLQVGTDATASNNFTIYQPDTPDGTLKIGVGNADSPTEVAQVTSSGLSVTGNLSVTGSVPANTGPAFSAYLSANQTISSSTFTKVQFNTKEFDTNSNYDNATNYRFTPTVAGYYQINSSIRYDASTTPTRALISIYKNGSDFKRGNDLGNNSTQSVISTLIYFNGSTDYIECWVYITASTAVVGTAGPIFTYFQAHLARAA